ncbi:hypothetical protein OUZ56_026314 [Daphnia magna]|uniref:Uncharacterized protein n=1 Tax=Daphnia magna TaxID=35525 RepID=A0ABQ9ZLU4_9CRUS|nr:hypothetical protein OUZ56_026314 [Daphnia magna]
MQFTYRIKTIVARSLHEEMLLMKCKAHEYITVYFHVMNTSIFDAVYIYGTGKAHEYISVITLECRKLKTHGIAVLFTLNAEPKNSRSITVYSTMLMNTCRIDAVLHHPVKTHGSKTHGYSNIFTLNTKVKTHGITVYSHWIQTAQVRADGQSGLARSRLTLCSHHVSIRLKWAFSLCFADKRSPHVVPHIFAARCATPRSNSPPRVGFFTGSCPIRPPSSNLFRDLGDAIRCIPRIVTPRSR